MMNTATMTEKEAFLYYMERMDMKMLDLILDDGITYFGASKKVFLEKLTYIFEQYRLTWGKENLKIEQHKRYKDIYYLCMYPPLHTKIKIFIEERENKMVRVYNKRVIKDADDAMHLNMELYFGDDERADFKPSNEYMMTLQNCINAYEELINDEKQILTGKDINDWVMKHALLYKEVVDEYMLFKFNEFKWLYFILEDIIEKLKYYELAKKALKSFLDDSYPDLWYKWLCDYDRLFFCHLMGFNYEFIEIDGEKKGCKFAISSFPNLYFKGDDFLAISEFVKLYNEQDDIYRKKKETFEKKAAHWAKEFDELIESDEKIFD